ncbi:MAG: molybdopterin-dependent oxidoreductase [Thermoprotei archaeon]
MPTRVGSDEWRLRVRGRVGRQLELSLEELRGFDPVSLTFDFRCLEGWIVEGVEWQGVRLRDVLAVAQPLQDARHAVFKAGDYSAALSLDEALNPNTILAYSRRGVPLSVATGGPIRLVFPAQLCYESVKWLAEVELTSSRPETTARKLALGRISVGGTGP